MLRRVRRGVRLLNAVAQPSVVVIWMQRFEEIGSVAAQDAKTGPEALFGVLPVLQDELTERRGCWPDEGGIPADTADGPAA